MNVSLDTYYAQMYYTCSSMSGVLVGGGVTRVCYWGVNSQEDGVLCVHRHYDTH